MLSEWTMGMPARAYTYDGAGRMVEARVLTLTTRFRYTSAPLSASNGLGTRLAVEVVGRGTTTYTLDYADGGRVLAEATITGTTRYLYGYDCLGEFASSGWLYYLTDGSGYVRQGANTQGQVVSGKTPAFVPVFCGLFDPDGAVREPPGLRRGVRLEHWADLQRRQVL